MYLFLIGNVQVIKKGKIDHNFYITSTNRSREKNLKKKRKYKRINKIIFDLIKTCIHAFKQLFELF